MVTLSDAQRRRLSEFADRLIPAADGGLSAGDIAVASIGVDQVVARRPDLVEPLIDLLNASLHQWGVNTAVDPGRIERFLTETPGALGVLGEVVAGAYFLDPRVADYFGYHGRQAILLDADQDYDDLLAPVIDRGPIYRSTPATSAPRHPDPP